MLVGVDIAGDAILSGFILDADQVRINALNLVLESLQDEMSASGGQGSVRIDPFSLGKLSSLLTSVGGGMERQMSRWAFLPAQSNKLSKNCWIRGN